MRQGFGVFEGKIEPNDIKQGRLGNCYFLSALASISSYPFIVKRLFQTTEVSSYHYYGVWLFVDGIWRCIVIDDYFPVHRGAPFFSRNNGPELWVLLFEKAYAKLFGSYQSIESGLTGIAFNSLTGAPYQYLIKDSKSQIDVDAAWKFITSNFERQHLLTGSTENNDRNSYQGLVSSHAYTILDVQEVHIATKKGKKKEKILKLSNPWGKYEWKGRWSDYSDVWSQELRQQLQFEKADDGKFWISIEDFVESFGQVCSCKYNKNYLTTSLPLSFDSELDK